MSFRCNRIHPTSALLLLSSYLWLYDIVLHMRMMTRQENQINLTRNNIIIYFYHHRRRHHLLFYLVVIQSLAFLLHQQRMLSYVCHTEPLQHMPAGNDTMIYCVSGRANNYGKSSQSHEKIVGNACERKQIEIFLRHNVVLFRFFLSLVFFDESVSFGLNRIYWYFFSPSFRFFLRDRKKNIRDRETQLRCLCEHVQAISRRWCVTEITHGKMEKLHWVVPTRLLLGFTFWRQFVFE